MTHTFRLFISISVFIPTLSTFASKVDSMMTEANRTFKANLYLKHNLQPSTQNSTPYYNFKRDVSFVGLGIFGASIIIKNNKTAFHYDQYKRTDNFISKIDDYARFSPYPLMVGMKLSGYEGRSSWGRFLVSTALSNITMVALTGGIKKSTKELRPSSNAENSFPSGHTAVAFTAATILHKEYGLTRSAWFSIGGYSVAAATGAMRIINNHHMVSDVIAGTGIGILSAELGYWIGDLTFRGKGIHKLELERKRNTKQPSFIDIQLGMAIHSSNIKFSNASNEKPSELINLGTSTIAGIEGAYFLNSYIGLGGMARLTSTPIYNKYSNKGIEKQNYINTLLQQYKDASGHTLPTLPQTSIVDNNFAETSLDAGVYANIPLGDRFSLGTKFLAGIRSGDKIEYKSQNDNEEITSLKVNSTSAFNYVTGISLSWTYKNNCAWKLFIDYDASNTNYKYESCYFGDAALQRINASSFKTEHPELWNEINHKYSGNTNKSLPYFTIGGAFTMNF